MKTNKTKSFVLIVLTLCVLLFATSCYSTIGLRTLVPAEVNVAGYKTIAVQSTSYNATLPDIIRQLLPIPVRGNIDDTYSQYLTNLPSRFDLTTSDKVTSYTSKNLAKAIDKGFFTVKGPDYTDALIAAGKIMGTTRKTLLNSNIDALLTSNISYMYYDEYITAIAIYDSTDTSKVTGYNFYLVQNAAISLTYMVTDVEANVYIANKTQSISSGDIMTKIGHTDPEDIKKFVYDTSIYVCYSATEIFESLVDDFFSAVTNQLSPHYETVYIDLMANKPKVESLQDAYKYVDSGNYKVALEMFLREYNASGHIASGYNAAVLYYALGDYDDAFTLSWEVYNKSGNSNALELYYTLKNIKENQDAAIAQINGTKSSTSNSDELIGF